MQPLPQRPNRDRQGPLIFAERREGGVQEAVSPPRIRAGLWRAVDSNTPLGVKLMLPLVVLTLAGSMLFGYLLAQQELSAQRNADQLDAVVVANHAVSSYLGGEASVTAIDSNIAQVNKTLAALAKEQPQETRIWIVELDLPGGPVVASSIPSDVGKTGFIDRAGLQAVIAGRTHQDREAGAGRFLDTEVPVPAIPFAAVVWTSLQPELTAAMNTVLLIAGGLVLVCGLEIAAMLVVLEGGVLRRIRRIHNAVLLFRRGVRHEHLYEGFEPVGRDSLFNLAIEVDRTLDELQRRAHGDNAMNQLGVLALQSASPGEVARKALDIVRGAADLDRCFLVDARGHELALDVEEGEAVPIPRETLPLWLGALVRAAATSRRPILSEGLGQVSRYWEADTATDRPASAVFVPLPGTNEPMGVMVGVAALGNPISAASVALMEAVASTLGEALQRSEAQKARQESEIKSRALSTVSHEMRNPISAMLGFTDLLLTGSAGPLTDKQRAYLSRVSEASQHLLRLVNDYLDLSKVMAGSLAVHLERVAVAPEVESVVGMMSPTAAAKNVLLRTSVAPDVVAFVDQLRLRQILTNLISNAIQFTPARGYVRVEAAGGANGVRISVIDTGVGIPADRHHLVFQEFAQLRTDGKAGETGIALALTKRFVEAMGGFIQFTSSDGAGSVFDVWLPGERSPKAVMESPAGERAPERAAS